MIATKKKPAPQPTAPHSQPSPHIVKSLDGVADFFDVSKMTVSQTWRRNGMPWTKGYYDLREIRRWRDSRNAESRQKWVERKNEAELAIKEEQAKKLQMENQLSEGNLVLREDAIQEASEMTLWIKSQLEAIPEQCSQGIPPKMRPEIIEQLKNRIRVVLMKLSNWKK